MLVPSAKATSPLSKIKELLLASVLIQASWFLVMVLVDFSTIGLATISSFPSQVIANHQPLQTTFIAELKKDQVLGEGLQKEPKAMRFNTFGDRLETTKKQLGWEKLEIDTKSLEQLEPEAFVDMLLPKPDTLSGPLTYLGFTVFKTHSFLKEYRINDANSLQALTKVLITLMFDAGMIILYAFALLILVVILIVRLVYLWVFIAASPIIFLMATTKILDLSKIASFLDWKKILSLIFQPVLFALRISVMFLVIVVLQGFFSTRQTVDFDNGSVVLKESVLTSATQTQQYRSDMTIAENVKVTLLQGTKSFQDILLGFLALAMMRYFVKLAVQTKTGIS